MRFVAIRLNPVKRKFSLVWPIVVAHRVEDGERVYLHTIDNPGYCVDDQLLQIRFAPHTAR